MGRLQTFGPTPGYGQYGWDGVENLERTRGAGRIQQFCRHHWRHQVADPPRHTHHRHQAAPQRAMRDTGVPLPRSLSGMLKHQDQHDDSPDDSTRDLLRDTATRLFQDLCTPAALRDAKTGAWPAALWRAVEDAGLPRALVPKSAGGSGVNFTDAMVIVRAAGRFGLPCRCRRRCSPAGCWPAPACRSRTAR